MDYDRAFNQLVHLAALNLTDKVDGAIENLVMAALAIDRTTGYREVRPVADAIFILFGAQPSEEQTQRAVDHLLEGGRLSRDVGGNFVAPPAEVGAVEARVQNARELEARVRGEWLDQVSARLPDAQVSDVLWHALQRYLALSFRRHGAETAQLLDPSAQLSAPQGTLSGYLSQAIKEAGLDSHRALAAEAIDLFLSHSTPDRTLYLAQLLDGTFTFFAITLDEATSAYLKSSLLPLSIFLDTNYIFGLLDLHENYFVRASKELVRLIHENDLPFELYYHEYTYAEIVRTLQAQAQRLRSRRWTVALSRAAVEVDAFDGLERLYHEANAKSPTDVDAFLSRYENVPLLLNPLGIEMYREPHGEPFTTEEKGLLIADYSDFLENVPRSRTYPAMDHDASLWLALRRLRNPGGSVLDSGAVILTNDYWFHRFDKRLGPHATTALPGAVVLPAQLLQLLRPLVPATDDFDRRFVETFALPEFRTAQSGYSATTAKVLSYLATYRDLPTETAAALLKSHALASRLHGLEESSPAFQEAVESELIDLNRELLEEKVQLEAELAAAKAAAPQRAAISESAAEAPSLVPSSTSVPEQDIDQLRTRTERAERNLNWTLRILAAVLLVIGVVAIYVAPALVGWETLEKHPHAAGLKLAAAIVVASASTALAFRNRAGIASAALGVVIAVVIAVTQII